MRASTARLQHNEEDRNIATLQKTLHHPHERHARVNVGARPREVRKPTYKIPPVSPGSVATCTTTLRHIAEEHNIVTLQKLLNTQYRQLTRVSVGAQRREVRKPTHKIPPRKTRRGPWEQLDSVRLTWAHTRSPLGRKNTSTMSVQSHLVRRPCHPPDSTAVHRRNRQLVHCSVPAVHGNS